MFARKMGLKFERSERISSGKGEEWAIRDGRGEVGRRANHNEQRQDGGKGKGLRM